MRAAFYEKDITPPLDCYLCGAHRRFNAEDVLTPLFVRAAVIEAGGVKLAMVGIDACEFPDDLHDAVTERIEKYAGIAPENVLISVTHTHKGIPIQSDPDIRAYDDEPYKNVAYRLIADSVILADKRLKESEVTFGMGYAEDISFNRNFIMRDGTYLMNEYNNPEVVGTLSGIDPEVPVLFFRQEDGTPQGAVVSFACHNDVNPGSAYAGGFPYILSQELKKKYGENFVTVYFAGASGDINHINPQEFNPQGPPMPTDCYIHMGKRLAEEVIGAIKESEPLTDKTLAVSKELLDLPLRAHDNESVLQDIAKFMEMKRLDPIRNITHFHSCSHETSKPYFVQVLRIGDVYIFTYPGEIYVDFGLELKKRVSSQKNMIATLANGGCGYVPTRQAFDEKSRLYETMLCFDACVDKEAGYIINDKLIEMADKLKNKN